MRGLGWEHNNLARTDDSVTIRIRLSCELRFRGTTYLVVLYYLCSQYFTLKSRTLGVKEAPLTESRADVRPQIQSADSQQVPVVKVSVGRSAWYLAPEMLSGR